MLKLKQNSPEGGSGRTGVQQDDRRTKAGRFEAGHSGNPRGRPKETFSLYKLAQSHAPAALQTLVAALKDSNARNRITAASIILDRAYGKAPQAVSFEGQAPQLLLLHLEAAKAVGLALQPALEANAEAPIIDLALMEPAAE